MVILTFYDIALHYLSYLDYVDIKNLRRTCKELGKICKNNTILRDILVRRDNLIILDDNISIYETLDRFYKHIEKDVIGKYFPKSEVPIWVDYEKFKMMHTKKVASFFATEYSYFFDDMTADYKEGYVDSYITGTFVLDVDVLIPFRHKNISIYGDQMSGQACVEIEVGEDMKKYMLKTLEQCFNNFRDGYSKNVDNFRVIIGYLLFSS